jgi:DNA-binding response OmpR family regulator
MGCFYFILGDIILLMEDQSKKQIFLIEDDQFLSSLLKNRLEKESFEVIIARTGDEALELLKTAEPSLIMLDIILPGTSGFEVLEKIRSDIKTDKTPVVIISNLGQEADMERAKQLGGVLEYFVKAKTPIDELVKRVKELLAS